MDDVTVYDQVPECHVTFGKGGIIMCDVIPKSSIKLPEGRFQMFSDIYPCRRSLHDSYTALGIKHLYEEQALTYRMSCEINTQYADED